MHRNLAICPNAKAGRLNLKLFQTGNPGLEDFKDFKSSKSAYVFSTPADKSINVENEEKNLVEFYKRYLFA